jgi:uncharacterized membrane protein SirB2
MVMDDIFRLLLFIHLGSMGIAVGTNVVMPLLVPRLMALAPDARGRMQPVVRQLGLNARLSLLMLVLTGIAMVGMRYGSFLWQNPWFIAKMVFVVLILLTVLSSFVPAAARAIPPRVTGLVMRLSLIGVIFCAVMSFN